MFDNELDKFEQLENDLSEFIAPNDSEEELSYSFEGDDYDEEFENFDDVIDDIDFNDFDYSNFSQSFSKVKKKLVQKKAKKIGRQPKLKRKIVKRSIAKKPLTQEFYVKKRASLISPNERKLSKVIVPSDRKVIVEGVNKFILSQQAKDDTLKNIGYYKGEKLNELVLTFNNNSPLDFNLELFNPSMPLDYLYSTSLNLNDKITVAGGAVSYTDVLYNLLANPAMIVNCKFVFAGALLNQQIEQPLIVRNKAITGVEKVEPLQLSLQLDTMQFANDIVFFDITQGLNRPFIPDGMDIIGYKVLPFMTVTMAFFYKQTSLKKVFYPEAKNSKKLL